MKQKTYLKNFAELYDRLAPAGLVPPQAIQFEQSLLGAMMIDKSSAQVALKEFGERTEDDSAFYRDAHTSIYCAMLKLDGRSEPIDLLTVTNQLRQDQTLEAVGGPSYLAELTTQVVTTVNIQHHARIILEKYLYRELIRLCEEIKLRAFEQSNDVFDLLGEAEFFLSKLTEVRRKKGARHASAIFEDLRKEIIAVPEGGIGIPTGFPNLDSLIGGLRRKKHLVIAGMTSKGKTGLAAHLMRQALLAGEGVIMFMLEDEDTSLALRLLAADTGISNWALQRGQLNGANDWNIVLDSINMHKKLPLFIDDSAQRTIFDVRSIVREICSKHKIGLVVVDYLQLMTGEGETREREVASVSQGLRAVWKELDVAGVALSQLNRTADQAKEPSLKMFRDSGAIEQDARQVIFLHYPDWQEGVDPPPIERCNLILAKNSGGPLGRVEVNYNKPLCRFELPQIQLPEFRDSF